MTPEHLTYCTNVHPGESLHDVRRALFEDAVAIKARVSPNDDFNLGLRLSNQAAEELCKQNALSRFAVELQDCGLYVTTLNGFPYGAFHETRVKERVYRPDWQESTRVGYTQRLSEVLLHLLPDGVTGSISTVPLCFKARLHDGAMATMRSNLFDAVARLVEIERESGKTIVLALEPEPGCALETREETLRFFEDQVWQRDAVLQFGRQIDENDSRAETALRRHLGVCLDTCHAAVEFETPYETLQALEASGIAVPKIQVSAGLRATAPDAQTLRLLGRFDEPVYLHQVVIREGSRLTRFDDLPAALAQADSMSPDAEWRVHFHVPVFESDLSAFESTQAALSDLLERLGRVGKARQLEVETYTFGVLPEELRSLPLVDAIARELSWTETQWLRGAK